MSFHPNKYSRLQVTRSRKNATSYREDYTIHGQAIETTTDLGKVSLVTLQNDVGKVPWVILQSDVGKVHCRVTLQSDVGKVPWGDTAE